jgi:hypothetical protein
MSIETATILAIILGPVIAVLITLWYQQRKDERFVQFRVFLTLMSHRGASPPTSDSVEALNSIDVVFAKNPDVLQLWHQYYDLLHQDPKTANYQAVQHKHLELLSAIAKYLGYKNVQQTDIDKFYVPNAHIQRGEMNDKLLKELLRVLEKTDSLLITPKEDGSVDGGKKTNT